MISFLEGELVDKAAGRVVLSVGGTGYEVLVPVSTLARLPAVGRSARVHTRLQVRDDSLVLYGFSTTEERGLFDMLVSVSGVGPKLGLAFLSVFTPDALRRAVAAADVAALATVPGVGKKMAGRVVVDLKDRLGSGDGAPSGPFSEVREALLSLGLSPQEARDAMSSLTGDGDRSVEELLREALKAVGR